MSVHKNLLSAALRGILRSSRFIFPQAGLWSQAASYHRHSAPTQVTARIAEGLQLPEYRSTANSW